MLGLSVFRECPKEKAVEWEPVSPCRQHSNPNESLIKSYNKMTSEERTVHIKSKNKAKQNKTKQNKNDNASLGKCNVLEDTRKKASSHQ
jgi:hypothetical protein